MSHPYARLTKVGKSDWEGTFAGHLARCERRDLTISERDSEFESISLHQ
jgi:hypothetical protein